MGRWSRRSRLRLERLEGRANPAPVGAPDPSFGTLGTATLAFTGMSRATAVAVQPDGKIVAAGTSDATGTAQFAIARFNPDGSLDTSFSNDGMLVFGLGGIDLAAAVAVQSDGKIVAAGSTTAGGTGGNPTNFAVVRVTRDGAVDTTFDADGIATVDFGLADAATGVAIQPDGKLVLVGSSGQPGGSDFAVARLNPDGSVDKTFNGTGRATVNFGGLDTAGAVVLRPDGTIVVAGTTAPAGAPVPGVTADFAVARLTPAGALDGAFDADGQVTVDFGGTSDAAAAIALQPDGKVVVVGTAGNDAAFARLNADGSPDATFSGDGKLTFDFGGADAATGVAVQPDGNIVVAGTSNAGGAAGAVGVVARVTAAGGLDTSFGGDGLTTYGTGTQATTGGVALTPEGRVVVAGGAQTGVSGSASFVVARLTGTVEEGRTLAVGGSANGQAVVYAPARGTSGYTPTPAATLVPFGTTTTVNARTAVGDVNGDGVEDTILVTGPGTAIAVAVVSGVDNKTMLVDLFDPFGGGFTGGGFVAAADLDNDGRAEIIVTPDEGGGPRVAVFSLLRTGFFTRANFFGIGDPNFRGGARVAAGDVNADGYSDLVVAAGFGGGPRVAVFDGKTVFATPARLVNDFFAFEDVLRNGVFVAAGDVNGDGYADLVIGAGPGGGPRVLTLSGAQLVGAGASAALASPLSNFFVAGTDSDRGGVRVATKDADGDNRAEVVVGTGGGRPSRVRVYPGLAFTGPGEPAVHQDLDPYTATLAGGVFVG